MRPTVAVIGAGLSGLTVAYEIQERAQRVRGGVEVVCLEATSQIGGSTRVFRDRGFVCEGEPATFLPGGAAVDTLLRRLDLHDDVVPIDPASLEGFLFRNGRLRKFPTRLIPWLRSDLLPRASRFRSVFDRWTQQGTEGIDETVAEFLERRLGRSAGRFLGEALAIWCCGGDPDELSMEASCPELPRLERKGAGLMRPLMAATLPDPVDGNGPWALPRAASLKGGMVRWAEALERELADSVYRNTRVEAVSDMGQRGFRILLDRGAPVDVDAVVIACQAPRAAQLVRTMDPGMAHALNAIEYAPRVLVHFGYRTQALGRRVRGAGFLGPRGEGLRILGCRFTSNQFPDRAPDGSALLTSVLGGARDAAILDLDDAAIRDCVIRDLRVSLGIVSDPYFVHIDRYPDGIPQTTLGHPRRLRAIQNRLDDHRGLSLVGRAYRPQGLNTIAAEAGILAESILDRLLPQAESVAR